MRVSYKKIPEIVRIRMGTVIGFGYESGLTSDAEIKRGVKPKYWLLDSENENVWGIATLDEASWIAGGGKEIGEYLIFDNKGRIYEIHVKSVKFQLTEATAAYGVDV